MACSVCGIEAPGFHTADHLEGRLRTMTLAEAAILLGLDPGTLRVQIHNGKLKARKVGPVWTVTPREVERYRQESRREVRSD